MSTPKPHRWQHLTTAPKDILDVAYCLAVAKGERKPSEYALTSVFEAKFVAAEDIEDNGHAFQHGYSQGWEAEMCGRAWIPTPPRGMPISQLPHFCEGVLSGSDAVRLANEANAIGAGASDDTGFYDPFSDLGI